MADSNTTNHQHDRAPWWIRKTYRLLWLVLQDDSLMQTSDLLIFTTSASRLSARYEMASSNYLSRRTDKVEIVHLARLYCSYLASRYVRLDHRYATNIPVPNHTLGPCVKQATTSFSTYYARTSGSSLNHYSLASLHHAFSTRTNYINSHLRIFGRFSSPSTSTGSASRLLS
jgi:hypothetical protein